MRIDLATAVDIPLDGGTADHVGSALGDIAEIRTGTRQHEADILKSLACLCWRVAFPHQVSVGVYTHLGCNVDQVGVD